MARLFTALLMIYWTIAFALAVTGGLDRVAGPVSTGLGAVSGGGLVLLLGGGLVAALFLWAAVSLLFERCVEEGHSLALARLATVGALVLLVGAQAAGLSVFADQAQAAVVAALVASYVVVLLRGTGEARPADAAGRESRATARLMALGAAHASVLGRRGSWQGAGPEGRG